MPCQGSTNLIMHNMYSQDHVGMSMTWNGSRIEDLVKKAHQSDVIIVN